MLSTGFARSLGITIVTNQSKVDDEWSKDSIIIDASIPNLLRIMVLIRWKAESQISDIKSGMIHQLTRFGVAIAQVGHRRNFHFGTIHSHIRQLVQAKWT